MASSSGFLIEMNKKDTGLTYIGVSPTGHLGWVADVNAAIRFARHEDAQRFKDAGSWVIQGMGDIRASVQEHLWED